jgi:hypothetical protein
LEEEREFFQQQKGNFERERQKLLEAAHQLDSKVSSIVWSLEFGYSLHFAFLISEASY